MSTINRTTTQARDAQIIAGIGKRLQTVPTVTLLGTAYTPAQLTQLFQSQISSAASIAAMRAQLKDLLQTDSVLAKKVNGLVKPLKAYVENALGNTSEVLGDFGFAPAKATGPKDPVTKVVAAAKSLATREARGTTGKRKKEQIKGATPASVSISVGSAGKPAGTVAHGVEAMAAMSSNTPPHPATAQ
jgi:hypothetical protein